MLRPFTTDQHPEPGDGPHKPETRARRHPERSAAVCIAPGDVQGRLPPPPMVLDAPTTRDRRGLRRVTLALANV